MPVRDRSVLRRLRRADTSRMAENGRQTTAVILFPNAPRGAAEAIGFVAVRMVSVFVTAPPDAVNVTDGWAKLQEKYAGSVPHEKLTGPVKPPSGVTVKVTIPEFANGIVTVAGFTVTVNPGFTIVSIKGAEVLPVKFASPLYLA